MKSFHDKWRIPGVFFENGTGRFSVWAPLATCVELHLPQSRRVLAMDRFDDGYFVATVPGLEPGTRYWYKVDEQEAAPDPASYFQPEGVHGPSALVDHSSFSWTDQAWTGQPLRDLILYELHVGTFTTEGTFDAIIGRLDELVDTGINAIQLLPVAQFPGSRNWGYDGVYPYAVQESYGGVDGLKRLVDAAHARGISVLLDVVYNHVGPEGNYFGRFGPYFTDRYSTPWGDALNFDSEWCDGVREYFCHNALYWLHHFHLDGLRLDAVHMVFDQSAVSFWQFLSQTVRCYEQEAGRSIHLIAESDLNSPRTVSDPAIGGMGFSAQWLDDFHHSLYVLLDKNGRERYEDFGKIEQLAKAYKEGFVHSGEYVKFRKRKHGSSSAGISGEKFVVFNLNHDQIGNRPQGERLNSLVDFERVKLAAAALLLSPYIPMLFMGEEYGEDSPFFYFVSHSDPVLIEAVRKGRKQEFHQFKSKGEMPDPQSVDTFLRSKLQWENRRVGQHEVILRWYQKLITMRREIPAFGNFDKNNVNVYVHGQVLVLHRQDETGNNHAIVVFNFGDTARPVSLPGYAADWLLVLESRGTEWSNHFLPVEESVNSADVIIPPVSVCVFTGQTM